MNEHDIVSAPPGELLGTWLRFTSKDASIEGEVVEVYDPPSGARRILIEKESGVVKALPLWTLDSG